MGGVALPTVCMIAIVLVPLVLFVDDGVCYSHLLLVLHLNFLVESVCVPIDHEFLLLVRDRTCLHV